VAGRDDVPIRVAAVIHLGDHVVEHYGVDLEHRQAVEAAVLFTTEEWLDVLPVSAKVEHLDIWRFFRSPRHREARDLVGQENANGMTKPGAVVDRDASLALH